MNRSLRASAEHRLWCAAREQDSRFSGVLFISHFHG